jgi:hypothetical protein
MPGYSASVYTADFVPHSNYSTIKCNGTQMTQMFMINPDNRENDFSRISQKIS